MAVYPSIHDQEIEPTMHTSRTPSWEHALLSLATEALHLSDHHRTDRGRSETDRGELTQAYGHCDTLTALHSRSFHMASGLLPKEKRQAVRALYAFCRTCDDIVDRPAQVGPVSTSAASLADSQTEAAILAQLEEWRRQLHHPGSEAGDPVALAWADARRRFQIPLHYGEQLIDGVARDMHQDRYQTFEDLAAYSYGVASTVGLMSMHIIGFSGPEAVPYAIKLGVALQMTNILRDVGEDWGAGRLYLPLDELARFGLSEADIAAGVAGRGVDARWRAFMRFQLQRNRQLYAEAWPGIAMLDKDGRFAIAAAAELYQGILTDIERHDYNNFTRRAAVSTGGKLAKLPKIWWRSRRVGGGWKIED